LPGEVKEEHQRIYPGYKYTPRKPGQKKKRQWNEQITLSEEGQHLHTRNKKLISAESNPTIIFNVYLYSSLSFQSLLNEHKNKTGRP